MGQHAVWPFSYDRLFFYNTEQVIGCVRRFVRTQQSYFTRVRTYVRTYGEDKHDPTFFAYFYWYATHSQKVEGRIVLVLLVVSYCNVCEKVNVLIHLYH